MFRHKWKTHGTDSSRKQNITVVSEGSEKSEPAVSRGMCVCVRAWVGCARCVAGARSCVFIPYPCVSPALPVFPAFAPVLYVPALPSVSPGMQALPSPPPPPPPSSPTVSVARLPSGGSLLTSRAAGMPDGPTHQTGGQGSGWGGGKGPTLQRRALHLGPGF